MTSRARRRISGPALMGCCVPATVALIRRGLILKKLCVCETVRVVFECVGGWVFWLFKFARRRIVVNKGVRLKR